MKNRGNRLIWIGLLLFLFVGIFIWLWHEVFPAISGYGSKNLCSAIYLQHRNPDEVVKHDLSDFPVSLGVFTFNNEDSSTLGSVWGLAPRKTIYREGCGCTIINDSSEIALRNNRFEIPKYEDGRDTLLWPAGNRLPNVEMDVLDMRKLEAAIDHAMGAKTSDGAPGSTRAFLVLYDGMIVGERYAPGFDRNTVMLGWSMSKSLTAALIGVLVKKGKISIDDPAPIPAWKGTEKENITVEHLLQQTSGLKFVENYSRPSNVIQMLFSEGDMALYAQNLPLQYQPGTIFNYSGGNTNILSKIIKQTVGESNYTSFPYEELFHKINAYSFMLEPDASGTYVGSSYSYATARDFARFGLLYYNEGNWNGEQVLTKEWIRQSTMPSSADKRKHYGFQFWLNGYDEEGYRWFPEMPKDMYFADGYGGQYIFIIPSRKMMVVRLGLRKINDQEYLREVLEAFNSN